MKQEAEAADKLKTQDHVLSEVLQFRRHGCFGTAVAVAQYNSDGTLHGVQLSGGNVDTREELQALVTFLMECLQ
jgi:hypothetical protein